MYMRFLLFFSVTESPSKFELHSCGNNVKVTENKRSAHWYKGYSRGLIFSHRPFARLESMSVRMTGSGNVAIGIVQSFHVLVYTLHIL